MTTDNICRNQPRTWRKGRFIEVPPCGKPKPCPEHAPPPNKLEAEMVQSIAHPLLTKLGVALTEDVIDEVLSSFWAAIRLQEYRMEELRKLWAKIP